MTIVVDCVVKHTSFPHLRNGVNFNSHALCEQNLFPVVALVQYIIKL